MRRRYDKLLGPGDSPDKIYIRSTGMDRNILSAQYTVAGLFPTSEDLAWNESLNWQPFSIHTMPYLADYLLVQVTPCANVYKLFVQYLFSNETRELFEKYKEFREWLEMHSGTKVHSIIDLSIFYDTRKDYRKLNTIFCPPFHFF